MASPTLTSALRKLGDHPLDCFPNTRIPLSLWDYLRAEPYSLSQFELNALQNHLFPGVRPSFIFYCNSITSLLFVICFSLLIFHLPIHLTVSLPIFPVFFLFIYLSFLPLHFTPSPAFSSNKFPSPIYPVFFINISFIMADDNSSPSSASR